MSDAGELIDAIDLVMAPAQGRRKVDVECEIVREIVPSDLPALATSVETPRQQIERVSAQHHKIAQLMAQGRNGLEVSALTGYSQAYLSNLKNDPCFAELLTGYAAQRAEVFVDVLERMKALGVATIEELQKRIDDEPEKWTKRELVEVAELVLAGQAQKGGAGPVAGSGLNINVKFVSATPGPMAIIEGEVVG